MKITKIIDLENLELYNTMLFAVSRQLCVHPTTPTTLQRLKITRCYIPAARKPGMMLLCGFGYFTNANFGKILTSIPQKGRCTIALFFFVDSSRLAKCLEISKVILQEIIFFQVRNRPTLNYWLSDVAGEKYFQSQKPVEVSESNVKRCTYQITGKTASKEVGTVDLWMTSSGNELLQMTTLYLLRP